MKEMKKENGNETLAAFNKTPGAAAVEMALPPTVDPLPLGKLVIFTMSHKGGAGKSTFARGFLEHVRKFAPDLKVVAIDGQPKIGHLSKFYGLKDDSGRYSAKLNTNNPYKGVFEIDASEPKNLIDLVNFLELQPDILLVDLPGGAVESLAKAVGDIEGLKQAYREHGYELILALGINHLKSASSSIHDVMNAWGESDIGYIGILNLGAAEREHFIFYDGEYAAEIGEPAERLRAAGGKEFLLHELQTDSYALLDAAECPLQEMIQKNGLQLGHRSRLKQWGEKIDAEISKLGLIGYAPEDEQSFKATAKRYNLG